MTEYIKREELMEFPIRRNHYDRENGNKHFINGIETVLEYAENLPAADVAPVVHGGGLKTMIVFRQTIIIVAILIILVVSVARSSMIDINCQIIAPIVGRRWMEKREINDDYT
jgi:hypothetical protein